MATIGTFKKTGNEYVGEIITLNVQAQNVRSPARETRRGCIFGGGKRPL